MRKLLAANCLRIIRNKLFWLAMIAMAIFGIILPVSHYLNMQKYQYPMYIDMGFFGSGVFLLIVMAVLGCLFLGTEYSDGTIRNKLLVGHKRPIIYLSNLLTLFIAGTFLNVIWIMTYLCVGLPLLGGFQSEVKTILLFSICIEILIMVFASIFTLITMINQKKATAAVICLLCAFAMLFASSFVLSSLSEPEIIDGYTYIDDSGDVHTREARPNLRYLTGIKRDILEFLDDALPSSQALNVSNRNVDNPYILMLYSGVIILVTTCSGLVLFRRKDIK